MTNFESLLDNWKKKNLTPGEKLRLLKLLENKEGQDQFERLWEAEWENGQKNKPKNVQVENRLEEIRSEIKAQIRQDKESFKIKRMRSYFAVAATLVILLLGAWFVSSLISNGEGKNGPIANVNMVELQVEHGGKVQRVDLPDGSSVWLNVGTKLTYPNTFSDSLRKVQVEGEAFFDVQEDPERPFVVSFGHLETKVLGTTFFVSSYPDSPAKVTLLTGKVQVEGLEGKRAILKPNEQLQSDLDKETWEVRQVSIDNMGLWREGLLVFAGIPLEKLVPKLERWYGVSIEIDSDQAKQCWIHGRPTNKSILDVLESFKNIKGITYTIDEEGIIHIGGGNCD